MSKQSKLCCVHLNLVYTLKQYLDSMEHINPLNYTVYISVSFSPNGNWSSRLQKSYMKNIFL